MRCRQRCAARSGYRKAPLNPLQPQAPAAPAWPTRDGRPREARAWLKLVLGIGTSHGSMLSTPPQEWDGRAAADRRNKSLAFRGNTYSFDQLYALRQAEDFAARNTAPARQAHYDRCQKQLDALGDILAAAKPDIMVIIGDDQHEWFTEELQPTFGIFCGSRSSISRRLPTRWQRHTREEAAAPRRPAITRRADQPYPIATDLAEHMIGQAMRDGFDVAAIMAQPKHAHETNNLGHAYGFIYRRLLEGPRRAAGAGAGQHLLSAEPAFAARAASSSATRSAAPSRAGPAMRALPSSARAASAISSSTRNSIVASLARSSATMSRRSPARTMRCSARAHRRPRIGSWRAARWPRPASR